MSAITLFSYSNFGSLSSGSRIPIRLWGIGIPHPSIRNFGRLLLTALLILLSFSLFAETLALQSFESQSNQSLNNRTQVAPVVSNVTASQRTDGSKTVDIYYDLFDADGDLCDINFKLSGNNGASFDIVPIPANLSGDFGDDLPSGTNKHIVWNAGAESYTLDASYLYRVYADDGSGSPIPENFVLVAGGTFNNGTSYVTISSFYIDKYELTQAGYQAVMGTNPASNNVNANFPVEQVSWFNAIEYANCRSLQEGLTPAYIYSTFGTNPDNWPGGWNSNSSNHTNVICNWTANGYRLLTEMEWMFAAKGGNQSQGYNYSGSNDINAVAWYRGNSDIGDGQGIRIHEVGLKAANELGTFDMSGNLFEWCWDIHGSYPSGPQNNPTGASSGSYRVLHGGCWLDDAYLSSVSFRYGFDAYSITGTVGFRVIRISP
jgi:formylglycine-generating enzyme required for sulfatase activity